MAEFDEVIFDDEEFDEINNPQVEDEESYELHQEEEKNEKIDDLTAEVLKLQGITNLDKIKFEDENGTIIERSWDSLSREEQLNILSPQLPEEVDLTSDEITLINAIRESGMGINEYLQSLMPTLPEPEYKIDQLSDDDVYALDLMEKIGADNITEEELTNAIAEAKKNETLFKKTVEGLRKEYIKLQQDEEERQQNELIAQRQQEYNIFANSIVNEIRNFDTFIGQDLELSQEDSEELADFILNLDENGMSKLGKSLQNSKLLTEAAFWLLHKDNIIQELNETIQNSYKRGYEAAKLENNTKKNNIVFRQNNTKKQDTVFDDLDGEW